MADLMTQNEIDQLLKSAIGGNEGAGIGDIDKDTEKEENKKSSKTKTYSYQKRKDLRFSFPYQSPVIKREQYIFDPNPNSSVPEGAVVVRTIKNYLDFSNHRKQEVSKI